MAQFEKHQGESLAFKKGLLLEGLEVDLSDGWAARLVVKSAAAGLSSTALIDKSVSELSDNNTRFVCRITPTESGALGVGRYIVITELSNATQELNKELIDKLIILEQGAS